MRKAFKCKKCGTEVVIEYDEESKKTFVEDELKYCSKCREE